jgi:hypothetical protein
MNGGQVVNDLGLHCPKDSFDPLAVTDIDLQVVDLARYV